MKYEGVGYTVYRSHGACAYTIYPPDGFGRRGKINVGGLNTDQMALDGVKKFIDSPLFWVQRTILSLEGGL